MGTFLHPNLLGIYQKYRQATATTRGTSRASNPAWYQDALELNFQLHLRIDGATIVSFYHDRQKARWSNGPALTEEVLYDSQKLASFVTEAVKHAKSVGASSLGVVLHIADEFAVSELKPEFDSPGSLAEFRVAAVTDPGSILQDASVIPDQAAWRVLPYPAGGSTSIGTAITVSQHYAPFFKILHEFAEKENFPVITQALSAPLIAILGLQEVIPANRSKAFIAVLQYPWFTVLACFNEHSDLRLVRTLQHRGLRRPTNFRNSLATTTAALEFVDPDLFLVPLGSNIDTALVTDLQASFTSSRVEVVEQTPRERMPTWCPEPIIATQSASIEPTLSSLTFQMLRGEQWAFQDFLPTPPEIAQIYPAHAEIRLLQATKFIRLGLIIPAFLGLGYFVYSAFKISQTPEARFSLEQGSQTRTRLANLTTETAKIDYWNNLLEDRSKAWACMESFARMFPEEKGILVKTFTHNLRLETRTTTIGVSSNKAGYVRDWKITGFIKDRASQKPINALGTKEGRVEFFKAIAETTGNQSYSPYPETRSLSSEVDIKENTSYKPGLLNASNTADGSGYGSTFILTISQRFDESDLLAIDTTKAP